MKKRLCLLVSILLAVFAVQALAVGNEMNTAALAAYLQSFRATMAGTGIDMDYGADNHGVPLDLHVVYTVQPGDGLAELGLPDGTWCHFYYDPSDDTLNIHLQSTALGQKRLSSVKISAAGVEQDALYDTWFMSNNSAWGFALSRQMFMLLSSANRCTFQATVDGKMVTVNLNTSNAQPLYRMMRLLYQGVSYSQQASSGYLDKDLLPERLMIESAVVPVATEAPAAQTTVYTTDFLNDPEAINRAIQSVFKVYIYDENGITGTGSGFIAFDEHYFVTNYHVIEDSTYLRLEDDNGNFYRVDTVMAYSVVDDIAILAFPEGARFASLPLALNATLLRGQPVVAIGSPQGIKNTVSTGILSAFVRDGSTEVLQFTAAISHGNSGGALFNNQGQVIGVVYAFLEDGESLNRAVKVDELVRLYSGILGEGIPLRQVRTMQSSLDTLTIGDTCWWNNNTRGMLNCCVEVTNNSSKTVKSFELYAYPADGYGNSILQNGMVYSETTNVTISAGKSADSVYFRMSDAPRIQVVMIGVHQITYTDGSTVVFDPVSYDGWDFSDEELE